MTFDPLTRLAREEAPRVLALLARRVGDLELAEDAVQDALVEASRTWGDVPPDNPGGWLLSVARRRVIDRIRRADSQRRRADEAAEAWATSSPPTPEEELEAFPDERLRLIFLCCHPALAPAAQVALTLRLVGGLTTREIARAFLLEEKTLGQRISRAKRKIRDARILLALPDPLEARLGPVLAVLHLVFNEGYLSAREDAPIRRDLMDEALRLTRLLDRLLPRQPEVLGLLAAMLFHRARADARFDGDALVLLADQDRSRWDGALIEAGNRVLHQAMALRRRGPHQLRAVIASLHANAPSFEATDWPSIVQIYAALEVHDPSPIVRLNRAVALAEVEGPDAALALLDAIQGLEGYHLFHAARAELFTRKGEKEKARAALERALATVKSASERQLLEARLAALEVRQRTC